MNRDYAHIVHLVRERPWAVLPSVLATIDELVALHLRGERLDRSEIEANLAAAQAAAGDRRGQAQGQGVAVIPLYGTIVPKANLFTEMSGATSVQGFLGMLRAALADNEIGGIVIDVDSPGGLIDLMPEAAAEIRAARGQKPMVAVANTLMASAAYWLGAQFDEIVASPSSLVGSIGVYHVHDDLSAAMEQAGVKRTLISAGKYKVEGNPYEPLGDEARAFIQSLTDDAYDAFVGDVAKGRGAKVADVRGGYGQGRVLTAKRALAGGLVDRIASLDETVGRMVKQVSSSGRRNALMSAGERAFLESNMRVLEEEMARHATSQAEIDVPAPPEPEPDPPAEDAAFAFERERYQRRRPA